MDKLTRQQKAFADYVLETGNQTEAYMKAYPSMKNRDSAATCASKLLRIAKVSAYIAERQKQIDDRRIASAAEIMQYFTSVMRGEIKDQFDLDPPLAERTKAAVELAKRKIDIDKNTQGGGVVIVNNIPRSKT